MSGTVVTRRVASVPARTSTETWLAVVALVAAAGSAAETELLAITGTAAMLIADGSTASVPVVITPATGPRVRIYTVHGDEADETLAEETPLTTMADLDGVWTLSLPADTSDLTAAQTATADAPHVTIRDTVNGIALTEPDPGSASENNGPLVAGTLINTRWLQ